MNTNEIQAVIDMIGNKVAGGVKAAQPLAEELVRQYQARALFLLVGGVFAVVVALILAVLAHRACASDNEEAAANFVVFAYVCALACGVFGIAAITINGGNYFAPLCGLLGK